MVQDIWVDGIGGNPADGKKQATEFRTVAITGEREGGRRYFALDVTSPTSPQFLWLSPLPGTTDDLKMGETWNDLGPSAPPIGPIAEAYAGGSFSVNGTPSKERYVRRHGRRV